MSVYNKILHERGLRLLGGIVGAAIMASAINLFIVPQAHGVLIIKDPGLSNGCQFRHSLLTFSGYLRSRFRCAAPGCIQKKKSARLSSTGSFLCGANHFPTCSLHRFSIIYRML